MNITSDKVQFARDILEKGSSSIVLRTSPVGRDLTYRQGLDVYVIMLALLKRLDEKVTNDIRENNKDMSGIRGDKIKWALYDQADNFFKYLNGGNYSDFFMMTVMKKFVNMKMHLANVKLPEFVKASLKVCHAVSCNSTSARNSSDRRVFKHLDRRGPDLLPEFEYDFPDVLKYLEEQ